MALIIEDTDVGYHIRNNFQIKFIKMEDFILEQSSLNDVSGSNSLPIFKNTYLKNFL